MIVKMEFLRGSPVAVSTAVLFQKKNGTPMNTPPIYVCDPGRMYPAGTVELYMGEMEGILDVGN